MLKKNIEIKAIGKNTCTLSEWLEWVQKRLEVPEDPDKVYVVDYEYRFSKRDKTRIKSLKCFLTSKRLIGYATKSKKKCICIYLVVNWLIGLFVKMINIFMPTVLIN